MPERVIPAEAGIQTKRSILHCLDPRLHGDDRGNTFYEFCAIILFII